MILRRLYELARRENLLEDPSSVPTAIPCLIPVGTDGRWLGRLHDVRSVVEIPGKKKGSQTKIKRVAVKVLPVPVRPVVWDEAKGRWKTTDPAASGKEKPAVFLADTIARVLPVESLIEEKDRAKFQAQRSTFWRFLRYASEQSADPALLALLHFWDQCQDSSELRERLASEVEANGFSISDLCTFTWEPDRGSTVLDREPNPAHDWWGRFFTSDFESQQEGLFQGPCQVTGEITTLASSIKSKISGLIPIGCRAEAYLVTGLPSAESYGLPGAVSGMVSQRGVDGFTRALNTLIADELPNPNDRSQPGDIRSSIRIGKVLFLFWTRNSADTSFMSILVQPDPDQIAKLLSSPRKGHDRRSLDDGNDFYCLSLSGNSGRVVVRDYLEAPIPDVKANIGAWFRDLRIAGSSKDDRGQPTNRFPLWMLAAATAVEIDAVAPDVPSRLLGAAIQGRSYALPDSILATCISRLRAEGSDGFRSARMALIKLFLTRRELNVTETLNTDEKNPAYICGRLLAIFEEIQRAALGNVNASVVDKFFGGFCSAPGTLLGQLFDGAIKHLRKLKSDKPGYSKLLDDRVKTISKLLLAPPKGQLSLEDQGWFALGYYHEKANWFEELAERRRRKAAKKQAGSPVR
jgi:CRISPR-associated protein Cas8c/Csd1 subtype I-C